MTAHALLRTFLTIALVVCGLLAGSVQPVLAERSTSISFPALLLPTERDGVLTGNAQFNIILELSTPRALKQAEDRRAQLQDALLSVLFTAMADRVIVNGGIENGQELRRRLDDAIEHILGHGVVTRVIVFSAPQKL